MNWKCSLLLTGMIVWSGGCTLAPRYTRPDAPIPAEWPSGAAYGESTRPSASTPAPSELNWQEFFPDERLRKAIQAALEHNRDLRLAALNVERARTLYGIQSAELLPTLGAAGAWYKERVPAELSATRKRMTAERYSVAFGLFAWEIDFFGRIRSLRARALEEYLATEEARRSAQVLLISSVAGTYLTLAADREGLKLADSTLEAQEASYRLVRRRYEIGLASELDLRQAQTLVETARGDVARTMRRVAQGENGLNLLLGSKSPAAGDLLPVDLASVKGPMEVSPGISSEVLLRRPDILSVEHSLKAANANIGAARAAFFPRISLTSTIGTASTELSGLFDASTRTWLFTPQILMPIFDARLWSAYGVTKVDKEIALARYERAIQTAFREVADTLALRGTVDRQLAAQQSLVDAVAEAYRLSNYRYQQGIDNYLSVLDAQRSLYSAEQGLIALRLAKLANLVNLYAALGGGA